jgi:hypothetical protein
MRTYYATHWEFAFFCPLSGRLGLVLQAEQQHRAKAEVRLFRPHGRPSARGHDASIVADVLIVCLHWAHSAQIRMQRPNGA